MGFVLKREISTPAGKWLSGLLQLAYDGVFIVRISVYGVVHANWIGWKSVTWYPALTATK